jgi:hypothetical protein
MKISPVVGTLQYLTIRFSSAKMTYYGLRISEYRRRGPALQLRGPKLCLSVSEDVRKPILFEKSFFGSRIPHEIFRKA